MVAAVGPLTNVADALQGPHSVEQLVIMGGDITSGKPEHNISCDVAAAQAVFAAGVPAVVTGIDQTKRVVLDEDEIAAIEASGALGRCSRPRSVSSGVGLAGRTARTTRSPSWPPYDPSCSPLPAAGSG